MVTVAAQAIKFLLQLTSTMLLARLLLPTDFGLVAMVGAITGFVAVFRDAGLSMATIQRHQVTHAQVSTLFWVNVLVSLLLTCIVAGLAPLIALLYREPRLSLITLALSSTMLLGGIAAQHQALLRRQMCFASLALIDLLSLAIGTLVAIAMSLRGFGYWSLVLMQLVSAGSATVLSAGFSGWRPGLPRRGSGVRSMLAFGGTLSLANILVYIRRNLDNVLLGATWGASTLGLYTKAYQLLLLPIRQVNAPLSAVIMPALSRLQDSPDAYRAYYRNFLLFTAAFGFPLATISFLYAPEIVRVFLGPSWTAAAKILQLLAPALLVSALNTAAGVIFVSYGRTDVQLRANLLVTPIVIVGMSLGLPYGAHGLAIGSSVSLVIAFVYLLHSAVRCSCILWADICAALWRPALATILATLAHVITLTAIGGACDLLIQSLVCFFSFAVMYALCTVALPGGSRSMQGLLQAILQQRTGGPSHTSEVRV